MAEKSVSDMIFEEFAEFFKNDSPLKEILDREEKTVKFALKRWSA